MLPTVADRAFSSLFLSSNSGRPPLRVGLLLDNVKLTRAQASVVHDINSSDFARIELLIFNSDGAPAPPSRAGLLPRVFRTFRDRTRRQALAYGLYMRMDKRRVGPHDDPRAREDCSAMLKGIDELRVRPITKRFEHRFPEEALTQLRAAQLDVIVRFGFNILRGGILDAAQYGVWSFHHGDSAQYRGGPACFWEMAEGSPLTGVVLQRLTEDLDAGLVMAKGLFPTDFGSLIRNRAQPYFGSTHMVIQKLRELHEHGWAYLRQRCPPPEPYRGRRRIYRTPTNWEVVRWIAPLVAKKAASRIVRAFSHRDEIPHWRIAIRSGRGELALDGAADMSDFRWIEAPKGHFYADPFVLERNGRTWVFFEDFSYAEGRGTISCAGVNADGCLDSPHVVLNSAGHLSYPCVFADGADVFMIPESSAETAVRLYRATDFPHHWEMQAELYSGSAVDTTPWNDGERWWFFTTLREPRGNARMLMLFYSATITGPWVSHPMNPISLDARNARGAGAIFSQNGKVIRPSQDCGRDYGHSFTLNEIVTLSTTQFEERPLVSQGPDWFPGLLGTHTYNRSGSIEVTDGTEVTDGKVLRARRQVV
jgi:hypothetical protein